MQVTIEGAILEGAKVDVFIAKLETRFPKTVRSNEAWF